MQNFFKEKLEVLKVLENTKLQFGIFDEDGSQEVKYITYDLDGNEIGEESTTLRDIMYLTEKGTIVLQAYRILERIMGMIQETIEPYIDNIIHKVMAEDGTAQDIKIEMEKYADYVNMHIISSVIDSIIAEQNNITNILEDTEKTSVKAVYSLKTLKKFIKCKFFLEI